MHHDDCSLNSPSGLVHVGDELREVNGNLIIHKRPEEISQILVCSLFLCCFTKAESFP